MTDTPTPRKPASKVDRKYRNLPSPVRYEHAIKLVEEDGWSARAAAGITGVHRGRLGERLKERADARAEVEARSTAARAERSTREPAMLVTGETRRVPPIGEFVRMYFDGIKCPRHDIHHEIPGYQDEIMEKIVDPNVKRLLINVPPGHSKSTSGTVFTTIYDVCRDPNTQIALISGTTRMAQRFMRQVKQFMSDPIHYRDASRNLIEDWGPFVDSRGNLGNLAEFYVAGRQSSQKDPTVSAYGLGQQIQGARMDRIIGDDVALIDNSKTPERVENLLEVITQDWLSRLDESGELVILGTRVNPNDIYGPLQEMPAFEVIRYSCIQDEESQAVLWPEHFNYDAAVRQRGSMTMERFELVYQNTDIAGHGASFTQEHLERCYDTSRTTGSVPDNCRIIAGLDPAGSGDKSGYTAMVLMAVDVTTGRRYLIDTVNHKQMRTPQIHDQMVDWASRYRIHEFRVEYNGVQEQMFEWDQNLKARLYAHGTRMTGHKTHRYNKNDADSGVEAMATLFHNGQVSIPWGDIATRKKFKELCDQLLQFGMGRTSDLVMAMWFAELGCRDAYKHHALPLYDPRRPVPARLRAQRRVRTSQGRDRVPTLQEEAGLSMADRLWIEEQQVQHAVNLAG